MFLGFSNSFNALSFLMCMNLSIFQYLALYVFNPIQNGGPKRPLPISISSVTSTNVGISCQNVLTFSFNPFVTLSLCCRQSQSQINELGTKTTPSKMGFFWSNPYQTELVITSLIEMLELTKLWSHDHIYNMIGLTKKKFCW